MDEVLYQSNKQKKRLARALEKEAFLLEKKETRITREWEEAQVKAATIQSALDYAVHQYNEHKDELDEEVKKQVEEQPNIIQTFFPCEWVVQFDDDEPQIFATATDESQGVVPEVVIKLQNTSESHITFTDAKNNKRFRMYARPKI